MQREKKTLTFSEWAFPRDLFMARVTALITKSAKGNYADIYNRIGLIYHHLKQSEMARILVEILSLSLFCAYIAHCLWYSMCQNNCRKIFSLRSTSCTANIAQFSKSHPIQEKLRHYSFCCQSNFQYGTKQCILKAQTLKMPTNYLFRWPQWWSFRPVNSKMLAKSQLSENRVFIHAIWLCTYSNKNREITTLVPRTGCY